MAEQMPVAGYNECPWPMDPACATDEWEQFDDAAQERALALASATLRRLTGFRVGGCAITVRPCKAGCSGGLLPSYSLDRYYGSAGSFFPNINAAGYWVNSCGCLQDCSCTALCEVELPAPVGEVYEVKVDGAVIPSTDYVIAGNRLVWTGAGECPWPTCQDLAKDDTEVGTFSVRYLNAYPVDNLGAYAVGILALEYAQGCAGNDCRLPSNVISVARQGVSFEVESGAFPGGMTGIREVDAFIALWKPEGSPSRNSTVWSPGKRKARVVR